MAYLPDNLATVWITGGGRGIGRAVALRLAGKGAQVAISARSHDDLEAVAKDSENLDGTIHPVPLDVTDAEAVRAAFEQVRAKIGLPGCTVFNAGTHLPMEARNFSAETCAKLMAVNYQGAMNGLDAVLPHYISAGKGHVALMASVAGYLGLPYAGAYCASKAAVIAMAEALKPDLARHGIVLSVINPGFVETPLTDKNDFDMPQRISAEEAARHIVAGLRRQRFEIAFPKPFATGMKLLGHLPYPLAFSLTRKTLRDEG